MPPRPTDLCELGAVEALLVKTQIDDRAVRGPDGIAAGPCPALKLREGEHTLDGATTSQRAPRRILGCLMRLVSPLGLLKPWRGRLKRRRSACDSAASQPVCDRARRGLCER